MTTASKTFLVASVAAFGLSFVPFFNEIGYGALRPIGAVLFIVFFISNLLATEVALHDEQQRRALAAASKARPQENPATNPNAARPTSPGWAKATL